MNSKLVQAKSVTKSSLHRLLPTWQHLYVWPFALVVYPLLAYWCWMEGEEPHREHNFLIFGAAFTANVLAYLACHWSTKLRIAFTCRTVFFST